jgi:hypothetical protein
VWHYSEAWAGLGSFAAADGSGWWMLCAFYIHEPGLLHRQKQESQHSESCQYEEAKMNIFARSSPFLV